MLRFLFANHIDAHLVAGVVANGLVAISGFVFRRIGIVPKPAVKKTLSFPDPKPLAKSPFSIAGLKHLGEAHGDRFSDESEDHFTFRIAAERQGGTVGFMVRSPFFRRFSEKFNFYKAVGIARASQRRCHVK
jgi:hypothetical protein